MLVVFLNESFVSSTSTTLDPDGATALPRHDLFVVHAEADRAWVDGYLDCSDRARWDEEAARLARASTHPTRSSRPFPALIPR